MTLKTFKPYTKSTRGTVVVDKSALWKGPSYKPLTKGQHVTGGRNNAGRITSRHMGGGSKHKFRIIDFFRKKKDLKATVDRIEYDPNRTIQTFRIKVGQKTHDIEGHTDSILKIIALEPSRLEQKTNEKIPDDPKIITCSLDNTIRLWDSVKIDCINVLDSPEHSELSCMTFLVNCCLVATGHEDGALRLWNLDISSSVLLKSQKGGSHTNSISCLIGENFKDQEFLIAGSYDGTISIWEISQQAKSGKEDQNSSQSTTIFPQFSHMIDNTKMCDLDFFEGTEVLCVHFYENDVDGYLIVGGNSKEIQVYKLKTGEYFCTMVGHKDSVTCIAQEGNMLFTGSDDMTVGIWNTQSWYYDNYSQTKKKTVEAVGFMQGHEACK